MGIYYYAIDQRNKTIMEPPDSYSNKKPSIYSPGNPFPAMVMMKNIQGYKYEIINDMETAYEECCTWKDVTKEVYHELLSIFPEWDKKE